MSTNVISKAGVSEPVVKQSQVDDATQYLEDRATLVREQVLNLRERLDRFMYVSEKSGEGPISGYDGICQFAQREYAIASLLQDAINVLSLIHFSLEI
jgi:hypothetical protein